MKPGSLRVAIAATAMVAALGSVVSARGVDDAHGVRIETMSVSLATTTSQSPVVAIVATPSGGGMWHATRDGGVFATGGAQFFGSAVDFQHDAIVGMAATPDGGGYWLVDRAGAVFSFGNAPFYGSMGGQPLQEPVVGIAARPDGNGYWLVSRDGGVFAFHAPFYGSVGGQRLQAPVVGMATRPDGNGYWTVASDGGVFAFNAPFVGSMVGLPLQGPVVGIAAAAQGVGYALVGADGGLFTFGPDAPFYGSASAACPGEPAIGVTAPRAGTGYVIAFADARSYLVSPASPPPVCETTRGRPDERAADLLARLNEERAARGLAPLQWDSNLSAYAAGWSENMSVHGFRHSEIGTLLGPYNFVGENIATGSRGITPGALHRAWMHSDGHRANILEPGYTRVGIGAHCAPDGSLWLTQEFGRSTDAGPPPPHEGTPPVDPVARGDDGALSCQPG